MGEAECEEGVEVVQDQCGVEAQDGAALGLAQGFMREDCRASDQNCDISSEGLDQKI